MTRRQPRDRSAGSNTRANSYIRYNTCAVQQAGPLRRPPMRLPPMVLKTADEVFIQGLTREGRTFRPSDWAERLAGVMSSFRPGGAQPGSHLNYSPWCIPTVIDGIKCVIVNRALREYEPMAWDFVMNFAKDNDLQVSEGEPPMREQRKAA